MSPPRRRRPTALARRRALQRSATTALVLTLASPALATPPNLAESTRCLAEVVALEMNPRLCTMAVSQPCAGHREAEARHGACLTALTEAYADHAANTVADRAPMTDAATTRALTAWIDRGRAQAGRLCNGAETATAGAECRLLFTAVLAHMIEFHPRRLVDAADEET
ncbi:MAG: hypothetical protein AAF183_08915 [Pseudomonadota bacterium]